MAGVSLRALGTAGRHIDLEHCDVRVAAGILIVNGLLPALGILFTSLKTEAQSGSVWSPA